MRGTPPTTRGTIAWPCAGTPRRRWSARTIRQPTTVWGWRSASSGATRRRGPRTSARVASRKPGAGRWEAAWTLRRPCTREPARGATMHDLKFLRQNRERVEAGIALKGVAVDLQRFYAIEKRRLAVLHETEQLKARRNAESETIARKKKAGENADAEIAAMRDVGDRIKALDAELRKLEEESESLAAWIPNLPH